MPDDLLDTASYAQARELPDADAAVTSSVTLHVYKVEARTIEPGRTVEIAAGVVLDHVWRPLPLGKPIVSIGDPVQVPQGSVAVPIPENMQEVLAHGLLPYAAAQAHRFGFHSAMEAASADIADTLETRLVLVTYKRSFEIIEIGVSDGATAFDSEMDHIPWHDRQAGVMSEDEAEFGPTSLRTEPLEEEFVEPEPEQEFGTASLREPAPPVPSADVTGGTVDTVSAEVLGGRADQGNADLAEEPAPKAKGKFRNLLTPKKKKKA